MKKFIALLILTIFSTPCQASWWYLNTYGVDSTYRIARYSSDGYPNPVGSVISPTGGASDFDKTHVAWPTALDNGSQVMVYAGGYNASLGGWKSVGLWTSADGGATFTRQGPVLTANTTEKEIRVANVAYDSSDVSAPYKMWYSSDINASGLPTAIRYATSTDGSNWTRVGIVISADQTYDGGGITSDYVCKDSGGTWHVFYLAFTTSTLLSASAAEATSSSPGSGYSKAGVIYSPDNVSTSVTTPPTIGTADMTVASASGLQVNGAYVLSDSTQSKTQAVTIGKIVGNKIVLTGVVGTSLSGSVTLGSVAKNKISPSYVHEDGSGNFSGIFSGFGSNTSVDNEYTFNVAKISGSWVPDYSVPNPPFHPLIANHLYSLENPEPLRTSPNCSSN